MSLSEWLARASPEAVGRLLDTAERFHEVLEGVAAEAVRSGTPVDVGQLRFVPDMLIVEAAANGWVCVDTLRFDVGDGRWAAVFLNDPEGEP